MLFIARVSLGVAVAAVIWAALVWLSFQIPGSPEREMAILAAEWPESAENPKEFVATMKKSVWFGLTVTPGATGLLFGLCSLRWWRHRRKEFFVAAGSFGLLLGLFFWAAGGAKGLAAVASYYLGVSLVVGAAWKLKTAATPAEARNDA